jgi:hypothetical protein
VRIDEKFAKKAFDRFLANRACPTRHWRSGRNPPDYYLRLGTKSFAVEVTQVMTEVDVGTHKVSETGVQEALTDLVTDIEGRALKRGILKGAYVLHLCPVPRLRDIREDLIDAALRYIEQTQTDTDAPEERLTPRKEYEGIEIQKIMDAPSVLWQTYSNGDFKFYSDGFDDLTQLIIGRLRDKRRTLGRIRLPRILLLVDAYHCADSDAWSRCSKLQDLSEFHTVARVCEDFQCQVLVSRQRSWRSDP